MSMHSTSVKSSTLFPVANDAVASVLTPADRYSERTQLLNVFKLPSYWTGGRWVHLIHNWRTGGSSLTALLSVNFHDSYLKIGHPFTRTGWPVPYDLHPLQITEASQLHAWMTSQPKSCPAILAGHTYGGMNTRLGLPDADSWVTLREPAARMNSGLLRFHRKPMRSDHPDGGYVGKTSGATLSSKQEIIDTAQARLSHELNGMCRRLAGYNVASAADFTLQNLESQAELDQRPVDKTTFDLAMDRLRASKWIYLTEQVLFSILMLEQEYGLSPLLHPCSNLIHNQQWNASGITRMQESLLTHHRSVLEQLNPWDVLLYNEANKLFWQRWKTMDIPPERIAARRLLQSKPLLAPATIKMGAAAALKQIQSKIVFRASHADSPSIKKWILDDGLNAQFLAQPMSAS